MCPFVFVSVTCTRGARDCRGVWYSVVGFSKRNATFASDATPFRHAQLEAVRRGDARRAAQISAARKRRVGEASGNDVDELGLSYFHAAPVSRNTRASVNGSRVSLVERVLAPGRARARS